MKNPLHYRLMFLLLALCILTQKAAAVPGELDLSFNGTGTLVLDLPLSGTGFAVQGDGKIVLCGQDDSAGPVVRRLNANGSADPSFGVGGRAGVTLAGIGITTKALAVQKDGKILVLANATRAGFVPTFTVIRLNANGALDPNFGGKGYVLLGATQSSFAAKIAVRINGDIVAGGNVAVAAAGGYVMTDAIAVRIQPDGSFDPSFGTAGVARAGIGDRDDPTAIAFQPDGKVLAAGYSRLTSDDTDVTSSWVIRFNTDGTLDSSFNGTGTLITSTRPAFVPSGMVLQPDGRIVVAGSDKLTSGSSVRSFIVSRYTPSGLLDKTFNGTGKVASSVFGADSVASAVALQADGKIVVAGQGRNGPTTAFGLIRYLPDGSLDSIFDDDGKVATTFGEVDAGASAVAIDPSGRIVAAGTSNRGQLWADRIAIARYIAAPDSVTLPPKLIAPVGGGYAGSTTRVTFELPERAQPGSVKLKFSLFSQPELTLASAFAGRGAHTITFDPRDPVGTSGGAIVAGLPISDSGWIVSLSYRDALGNPSATVETAGRVTVDTVPPTIVNLPAPIVAEAASSAGAAMSFNLQGTDLNGSVAMSSIPSSGSTFPIGTTTVQVVATDLAGNQTRGSFPVTVRNTTPPTITKAVPSQTLFAGVDGHATLPDFTALLGATDNVGVASKTQIPAPGTVLPLGTYALRFEVRDAAGNLATSDSAVTVPFAKPTAPLTTVATYTGSAAPGAGKFGGPPAFTVVNGFGTPAIDDYRNIVATSSFDTIDPFSPFRAAIYFQPAVGDPYLVALRGTPPPGLDGGTFENFSTPVIGPGHSLLALNSTEAAITPTVAFVSTVLNPAVLGGREVGAWTDAFSGSLELVLRQGSPAPGLPAGVLVKSITSLSLRDGELLALVTLGGIATALDDTALLRMSSATTGTALLRKGAPFFNSTITSFSALQPAIGSEGQGRWHAEGGVAAKIALADGRTFIVKLAPDGTVTPLLRAGEAEPTLSGAKIASLGLPSLAGNSFAIETVLALAPGGSPLPIGQVTGGNNDAIIYRNLATGGLKIIREGASGYQIAGAVFGSFYNPVVNDQDSLLFFASLRGPLVTGANAGALWMTTAAQTIPRLVARHGNRAVGKDGANLASEVWSGFLSFALPDGADAGPVFLGRLSGPTVTSTNNLGLWATDSTGKLRLLLRTGETVLAGATFKTVSTLTLLNSLPGSFGARRSYNSTGSLAVLAKFTDTTQAVLRLDVP